MITNRRTDALSTGKPCFTHVIDTSHEHARKQVKKLRRAPHTVITPARAVRKRCAFLQVPPIVGQPIDSVAGDIAEELKLLTKKPRLCLSLMTHAHAPLSVSTRKLLTFAPEHITHDPVSAPTGRPLFVCQPPFTRSSSANLYGHSGHVHVCEM